MSEFVQCKNCGYLAVDEPTGGSAVEAKPRVRERGEHLDSKGKSSPASVHCYLQKRQMHIESPRTGEKVLAVIAEKIECDRFRAYRHGKTPKEHEEMTILDEVKAENRESAKRADCRNRVSLCVSILALVLSAIVGTFTVLSHLNLIGKDSVHAKPTQQQQSK